MTIRGRLTLAFTALLLATLYLCSVTVYLLMVRELDKEARVSTARLIVEAQRLALQDADNEGIGMALSEPSLADTVAHDNQFLEVRSASGAVVSRSSSLHRQPLLAVWSANRSTYFLSEIRDIPDVGPVLVETSPLLDKGRLLGIIVAGSSLVEARRTAAWLRDILATVTCAALIGAVLGGWWLSGMALRPVDRMTHTARSISAGALSRRLALRGPNDELHRLACAFDDMIDRLEQAFDRERQFTADAAHELRTPLTILQGEIDVTLRKPRNAHEYHEALVRARREVIRLARLVTDLLLLARVDAGVETLPLCEVELCSLLAEVADRFTHAAQNQGVDIRLEGPDDSLIFANADAIDRVITNLLENALRHTGAGDKVELRWSASSEGTLITITDTGPGIGAEHVPHVFRRFYRADDHRSRVDGGSGLGLALVKTIVEAHGGTISVESRPRERTAFTMLLPASPTANAKA